MGCILCIPDLKDLPEEILQMIHIEETPAKGDEQLMGFLTKYEDPGKNSEYFCKLKIEGWCPGLGIGKPKLCDELEISEQTHPYDLGKIPELSSHFKHCEACTHQYEKLRKFHLKDPSGFFTYRGVRQEGLYTWKYYVFEAIASTCGSIIRLDENMASRDLERQRPRKYGKCPSILVERKFHGKHYNFSDRMALNPELRDHITKCKQCNAAVNAKSREEDKITPNTTRVRARGIQIRTYARNQKMSKESRNRLGQLVKNLDLHVPALPHKEAPKQKSHQPTSRDDPDKQSIIAGVDKTVKKETTPLGAVPIELQNSL